MTSSMICELGVDVILAAEFCLIWSRLRWGFFADTRESRITIIHAKGDQGMNQNLCPMLSKKRGKVLKCFVGGSKMVKENKANKTKKTSISFPMRHSLWIK